MVKVKSCLYFTALLLSINMINAQARWKPGFGFDFGLGPGGMTSLSQYANPLIKYNATLSNNALNTGTIGLYLQFMKARENANGHAVPGYGFKTKLSFNSFSAESGSLTQNENIVIKVVSVPLLLRLCISANEVDVPASTSPDSYTISGNTLYYYPGQYSSGYRTTRSVYLYFGPQYDVINKGKYFYNGSTSDITAKFNHQYYSLMTGLEISMGKLSLDFSYQKGMKSIMPSNSNYINAFFVKIGIALI